MTNQIEKFAQEIMDEVAQARFTTIKQIKKIGNSGSVIVPKEYEGCHARVIVLNNPKESFTEFRIHNKKEEQRN